MESARDRKLRVCIVGASGKLGQYMVAHALDRGYEVFSLIYRFPGLGIPTCSTSARG